MRFPWMPQKPSWIKTWKQWRHLRIQASQIQHLGANQKKICAGEKRAEKGWCDTDSFLMRYFWQHIASGDMHGNVRDCEDSSRWERSCQKTNLQNHKGMINLTASFCVQSLSSAVLLTEEIAWWTYLLYQQCNLPQLQCYTAVCENSNFLEALII